LSLPVKNRLSFLNHLVIVVAISVLLPVFQVNGQEAGKGKALKSFEKAQNYFQKGEWQDCENELLKAIKADSTFAFSYIMLGDVFLETGRPAEAVDQYKKALQFNPENVLVVYNLLGNTLFSLERYAEASGYYEEILGEPGIAPDLKSTIEIKLKNSRVREGLMKNPVPFIPVNPGQSVNTAADEYINSLSADGSGIYFTRRMKNANVQLKEFTEDFYFAGIHGDTFENAVQLDYPPGKDNDAGAICISADGRFLFFTACFRPDSRGSCDLYFSEKKGDSWTAARNLGAHINSDLWDAQPSISPDGRTLYFASNREGSMGSSDIWKTEKTPDGGWSKPVNIGAPVNTVNAEMAPFIHFDNQTLYFSSYGHPGLGGADLFRSVSKSGTWTQPENMGYPINSSADELVFVVNAEGNRGYLSSNHLKNDGDYDIYMFDLYEQMRPVTVSYLKGKVFDKVSGLPLEAKIELIDTGIDSTIADAMSLKQNGEFLVCLPCNRDYALHVSCDGYLFYSEHFPLAEVKSRMDPVLKDIPLEPVATGKTMVLRNIFYETDQYQLKSSSFTELDKLLSFMVMNPVLRIEIGGHTDDEGTEEYNSELSMKRARAVYEYLLNRGIDAGRITYKGYGESMPVGSNETETGRELNRRTEITILKSD
jgi:outer membrane protein OmpA-like peptidoglycan-associated protein/tetratricopeptide (TPR) repeat protein